MPGKAIFQLMSAEVSLVGMVLAWLIPLPLGPRKRDHSWAIESPLIASDKAKTQAAKNHFTQPPFE